MMKGRMSIGLPDSWRTFLLMFAAIAAAEPGATSYVTSYVFGFANISVYYTILAIAVAICIRAVPRQSVIIFAGFGLLVMYFLTTSLWADLGVYGRDKIVRTIVVPPAMLAAGYFAARQGLGSIFWAAYAVAVYAFLVAVVVVLAGGGVTSGLEGLLSGEDRVLTYQRFGLISGLGAALMISITPKRSLSGIVCASILVVACVLSGGRAGVVLVVTGIAVRLALYFPVVVLAIVGTGVWLTSSLFLKDALTIALSVARDWNLPSNFTRFLLTATTPESQLGFYNRDVFFKSAVEVWVRNPLFGAGWGGFPRAANLPDVKGFYPHNIVVEVLAETGLVGLLGFAIVIAPVAVRLWKLRPDTLHIRALLALWSFTACGLLSAMVIGDWSGQAVLFLSIGLIVGTSDAAWGRGRARDKTRASRRCFDLASAYQRPSSPHHACRSTRSPGVQAG